MNDVTRILSAIEQRDPRAVEQLLPLVYDELRRLASQKLGFFAYPPETVYSRHYPVVTDDAEGVLPR